MSYKAALEKAWEEIGKTGEDAKIKVKFLADKYEADPASRRVLSVSCNAPAHDHVAILILHYLIKKRSGLPAVAGEWISFKELPGGREYYEAFRKRAIAAVIRKYGENPESLFSCLDRLPGSRFAHGDAGVVLEAFENVPVLITVWKGDEEFGAEASVLFDRNVLGLFCTEDVAVLAGIVAKEI